jgi:hypothetical protein
MLRVQTQKIRVAARSHASVGKDVSAAMERYHRDNLAIEAERPANSDYRPGSLSRSFSSRPFSRGTFFG